MFLLPRAGLFVCVFFTFLVYFLLSVPVQVIAWKDLSPKRPIMCRVGRKNSTHSLIFETRCISVFQIYFICIFLTFSDAYRVMMNVVVVDPVTFQEFYKCWKQNEVQVRQLATLNGFIDPSVEIVIKVSQLIKCSFGTGHIVLTHDR